MAIDSSHRPGIRGTSEVLAGNEATERPRDNAHRNDSATNAQASGLYRKLLALEITNIKNARKTINKYTAIIESQDDLPPEKRLTPEQLTNIKKAISELLPNSIQRSDRKLQNFDRLLQVAQIRSNQR